MRQTWWRWGELDKGRWRYLHDLIEDRIRESQENVARAIVANIRDLVRHPDKERAAAIEDRIWHDLEHGEIRDSHRKMLLESLARTHSRS